MSSERLDRLSAATHADVDAGRTPGVVTLIARHGKVVHVLGYYKAVLVPRGSCSAGMAAEVIGRLK